VVILKKQGESATKALSALNENISEKELIKNIGILKSTIEKAKYRAEVRASQGYQRQSSQPQQNIEKSVLLPPANTPAKSNIKFLGFE